MAKGGEERRRGRETGKMRGEERERGRESKRKGGTRGEEIGAGE